MFTPNFRRHVAAIFTLPLLFFIAMQYAVSASQAQTIGKVVRIDLEGGFWGIVTPQGQKFRPTNLDKVFQQDQLPIRFSYVPTPSQFSIQMWGTQIKLIDVEVLASELNQRAKPLLGKEVSQQALLPWLAQVDSVLVLDVRTPSEYASGHVPGAINIPHTELIKRIDEIAEFRAKPVVVYCEVGARASIAETLLKSQGFGQVSHLIGDMSAWRKNNLPQEKSEHGKK